MSPAVDKRPPSLNDSFRRLIAGLVSLGIVMGAGIMGETGQDGGFIKDAWEALKVPSPVISMVLAIGIWMVWREWMKDRAEHAARTLDYVVGMNSAAALRETDKVDKARMRERIDQLADENRKLKRRR